MKRTNQNQNIPSYRPAAGHQTRPPKKRGVGKAVLISLLIVGILGVVAIAGGVYVNQLLNLVDRTPATGDPGLDETDLVDPDELVDEPDSSDAVSRAQKEYDELDQWAVKDDPDVYHILLIGTDQREGETNGRSDAMIILSLNKDTKTIHLTSLMRAMYVAIPGHDWSMLNHSYSWGGADLLLKTIENNLRIHIDDYMVINFSGFTRAIDQVGGVNIELTEAEASYLNRQLGTSLCTGDNAMDGRTALAYARIRKLDSDFHRTGRQRTVVESLLKKSRSLNAIQLTRLAESLLPLVKTNLSQVEMLSLMVDTMHARNYPVKQLMLPEEEHRERIYVRKMEMYRFDFKETIQALQTFIYGS